MNSGEYTIGQLAKVARTKAVTIRYYEHQGLLRSPERSSAGYRIYRSDDRHRLMFILRCRRFGFSLENVRELLQLADQINAPCAEVDAKVARHLDAVRERLAELKALEAELQRLSRCCAGGGIVKDCRIIESLSGDLGDSQTLACRQ
jgi:DNA-binding transcriptional MerR regulator